MKALLGVGVGREGEEGGGVMTGKRIKGGFRWREGKKPR